MLKELFDVRDAVSEAVMNEDVRALATIIYLHHETMEDDDVKQALFTFAHRVATVTAYEMFQRLLTEEQLEQAMETLDELMEMDDSAEEAADD